MATEAKTHTHGPWTITIATRLGPDGVYMAIAHAVAFPDGPNRSPVVNALSAETADEAHDEALKWMRDNLPD